MSKPITYDQAFRRILRHNLSKKRARLLLKNNAELLGYNKDGEAEFATGSIKTLEEEIDRISEEYATVEQIAKATGWSRKKVDKIIKNHRSEIDYKDYPLVHTKRYKSKDVEKILHHKKHSLTKLKLNGSDVVSLQKVMIITSRKKTLGRVLYAPGRSQNRWYITSNFKKKIPIDSYSGDIETVYDRNRRMGILRNQGLEVHTSFGLLDLKANEMDHIVDFFIKNVPSNIYSFRFSKESQKLTLHVLSSYFTLSVASENTENTKNSVSLKEIERFKKEFDSMFASKAKIEVEREGTTAATIFFDNLQKSYRVTIPHDVQEVGYQLAKRKNVKVVNLYSQIIEDYLKRNKDNMV